MEEFEALSNDYEKKQCIGGIISEQILIIGGALSPIQALKKLAPNPSVLDKSTFANKLSYDELVEVTVNLVNSLIACRKVLKGVRTNLEDHDPIYPTSDSSPQLVSDICELKNKFDSFVSAQPAPAAGPFFFSRVFESSIYMPIIDILKQCHLALVSARQRSSTPVSARQHASHIPKNSQRPVRLEPATSRF